MKPLKTVKEVCELTGLSRKHLYYFHHEKIVEATDYANYSVEGHDGYKLYDEAAVEKLRQIRLYYQLGLKRNEIRDLMEKPDYDSNGVLEHLLKLAQTQKLHIERKIAALEYLVQVGTYNGTMPLLRGISLEELGQLLLELRRKAQELPRQDREEQAVWDCLDRLANLPEGKLTTPAGEEVLESLLSAARQRFGKDAAPFLLGLLVSTLGEGTAGDMGRKLSPPHIIAAIQFVVKHTENNRRKEK